MKIVQISSAQQFGFHCQISTSRVERFGFDLPLHFSFDIWKFKRIHLKFTTNLLLYRVLADRLINPWILISNEAKRIKSIKVFGQNENWLRWKQKIDYPICVCFRTMSDFIIPWITSCHTNHDNNVCYNDLGVNNVAQI